MPARLQVHDTEAQDMGRTQSPPLAADPAPPRDCPGAVVIGGAHGSLALARSLGRRGIPVWFFNTGHPIAQFSRYVRRTLAWPPSAADQLECLLEPETRSELHGWTLFPGGDPEVEWLSCHRSAL